MVFGDQHELGGVAHAAHSPSATVLLNTLRPLPSVGGLDGSTALLLRSARSAISGGRLSAFAHGRPPRSGSSLNTDRRAGRLRLLPFDAVLAVVKGGKDHLGAPGCGVLDSGSNGRPPGPG